MISLEMIAKVTSRLTDVATNKYPEAPLYLQSVAQRDAHLANRVFTAARDERLFQVAINESLSSADAFFKTTGLENDERLLQVTYPVGAVNYDEVAALFGHWIIGLQPEKWLSKHYKSLF